MKKNKGLIIITSILLIIFFCLGLIGLILSNKDNVDKKDYIVKYKYIINEEKNVNFPKKGEELEFDKAKCTNNVTGLWSEKNWKFSPRLTSDTTCTLYFKTKEYKVELEIPKGVSFEDNKLINGINVKKDESPEFILVIEEGKIIDSIVCEDEMKATFNENKVIVNKVTKDTKCLVKLKNDTYVVDVKAVNGNVKNGKAIVEFDGEVKFNVVADSNYILDRVECSNNQKGNLVDGVFTVKNVTSDTICTVTYRANNFKVVVSSTNGSIVGNSEKVISNGGTITFNVSPNENFEFDNVTCSNSQKGTWINNNLSVSNVTNNTACQVAFKEKTGTKE